MDKPSDNNSDSNPPLPPSHQPLNNKGKGIERLHPAGNPSDKPSRLPLLIFSAVALSVALFFGIGYFIDIPDLQIPVPGTNGKTITIEAPKSPGPPPEMVLLVMGVDSNYDSHNPNSFEGVRTDSMMLVRVSPDKNTVSIVSIPRDSKVFIGKGQGIDKINAAYAYGGAKLAVSTIENSFGIPIDNYVVINSQGIREVVDAIGGVKVYVEKPMKYTDRTAKLSINFDKGYYTMNGEQAEGYLRFRHDALGDIGRVRRQQTFLSALARKFKDPWMLTRIPALVQTGSKYIDTDLPTPTLMKLAWFGKDLDMDHIRVATLPGHPSRTGISYWIISPSSAELVLDRLLLDNPGPVGEVTEESPLKIGVFYPPGFEEELDPLIDSIESDLRFKVVCQTTRENRSTQIVEHTRRVNDGSTNQLRKAHRRFKKARLIFAPVGTTFEMNACSSIEDYTIIIGDEMSRSKTQ